MNVNDIIMNKLLLSVLPFRVWNHMFLCERAQYRIDMCNFCTKSFISNMKISDYINNTLFVQIEKFPSSIRKGIIMADKIQIFAHINVFIDKEDPFKRTSNFGSLYYENISSPFLVWKMYLDIICRIAFNVSERFILPVFISSIKGDCRSFPACTKEISRISYILLVKM